MTRPITIASDGQNPSISTPGSSSRTQPTTTALSTIAPRPSVSTESGTTRNASAGQTTALATPTTNPASSASQNESIANPGSTAASSQRENPVITVTMTVRRSTWRQGGRWRGGRITRGCSGDGTRGVSHGASAALISIANCKPRIDPAGAWGLSE